MDFKKIKKSIAKIDFFWYSLFIKKRVEKLKMTEKKLVFRKPVELILNFLLATMFLILVSINDFEFSFGTFMFISLLVWGMVFIHKVLIKYGRGFFI